MSTLETSPVLQHTPAPRPSARGVCFWYQSVQQARALASCRYRIGHFSELTRGADVVIDEHFPSALTRRVHTVVCVRPFVTPSLERELALLRRAGIRLIADYDDLLFAGNVSGLPASVLGSGTLSDGLQRLAHYGAGLRVFDQFIVSTRALRDRLKVLAPTARITLVPNGLSDAWVQQGRALYPAFKWDDAPTIRYFSGSPSHDRDFSGIIAPLSRFMQRHQHVRLDLVGHLNVDVTALPAQRVRRLPSMDYDQLPRLLRSSWVNLAPLAPSEFTECKSALKLLEAGAFDCPTLASPNDDVRRHQELGAPVVLCQTPDEWLSGLERLLDPATRSAVADGCFRHVMSHGMASAHLDSWLAATSPRVAS